MVSVQSMKEKDDLYLRFDELPCPEYDKRVTYNKVITVPLQASNLIMVCAFFVSD